MPKKFIKRFLPDHRTIRDHEQLKRFGTRLHDPNLWHLSRRSVPGAFAIGLFIAFIPIPFQMVAAAALAIVARVNLPISVVLTWATNPLTTPAIAYFSYKVGAWLLGERVQPMATFEFSFDWLLTEAKIIWEPLLLGTFVCGAVSAIASYFVIIGLWRLQIVKSWQARKLRRRNSAGGKIEGDTGDV